MHQLILMRHAKAEPARGDQADHDRALSPAGRAAAQRMRARLRELAIEPDVVLVSSARRTRETLDGVAFWDGQPNIEVLDGLYMAPAARMLEMLRELRETMLSVLVVGHNPGLHELALMLASGAQERGAAHARLEEGFPTMRAAEFLVLTPWRELKPKTTRLQRVIDPPPAGGA
ncbi:MAG TPA: histidine phosphatase family protein [Acidiphilium sp.]|jgi:phosphohistidine phosphatase|uniref:SixA phosphatase family protein n=1 Tax=unclassified Acidiphilium TaxID=2617493 RepID=UPI000BC6AFEC|nr:MULTISPECIES: histidine phosphatase family protein [unclassified Acidiphilium]OYV56041.1 MAG: phosphohistidine phosphatase [Acidiphilium sp. 20-67-58]OYV87677.1 MAG: phosphohistidine phosphatase [Acidiphilium sp. 21-68-69]HQT61179.1 histidine phosphatase family protein [Acidiphilium sp.]HQU12127.1 histidine phosphatase family protein [Acidiphilium sp.]